MDDLSGFDWSSKPGDNQPKPPPLQQPSLALRPSPSPFGGSSGRSTPLSAQGTPNSSTQSSRAKPAQDSFSSLTKFGPAKTNQNLSLAERQAQLEQERRKKEEDQQKLNEQTYGNGKFWDTLGQRGQSASPAIQTPPLAKPDDDDDLFAAFNKDTKVDKSSYYPVPESRRPAPASHLDMTKPSGWISQNGSGGAALGPEDDDPFGLNEFKSKAALPAPKEVADDEDFMGELGRPVEEVRRQQRPPQPEPGKPFELDESSSSDGGPPSVPQGRQAQRQKSVPKNPAFDRALAQLVDYGFSPEDARRGLEQNGGGLNVQAAANWLLDDAHRRSKEKAQGQGSTVHASQPPRGESRSPARAEPDFAKQAAAVGNSLFKTANSLWKTGQKKMQQAVADFQQEGDPSQPKWMRDAQQAQSQGAQRRTVEPNATNEAMMLDAERPRPSHSTSRQPPEPRHHAQPERRPSPALATDRKSPAPRWQQQSAPPLMQNARTRLNRLAADDDDSFGAHVSANRRKKTSPAPEPRRTEPEPDLLFNSQAPKSSQPVPQRPAQHRPPQAQTATERPTPRPATKVTRQIPLIDPSAMQTSTKHRLDGTNHFKRGDYAAAHECYASALRAVPQKHPLAILLLTNRALTALKTGEPKQAVTDADSAIELVGPGQGSGETIAVRGENGQDEQRDMRDLYGKALSRKAEALEQMERWADAGAVWQLCVEVGLGGANAIKGRQRCQNALAPKPKPAARPVAKPRPKPSAAASLAPQKESEAVTRMRAANAAAAKEDDEKFALSEKIDARVSNWRDGKRDNLRALLGSLDAVLWEGSGWKKVGMHELVMANKVKISYMKAIAKTHPDKLPQDASTEVRLIAGLVFATLNESWDKFKADNGL